MLRCTYAWTSLLKLTPKHALSFHAKNIPKQGCFCYFISNLTPKQVWAQNFQSVLTKTTPFSWKLIFSDPQDLKKTFSTFFLKNSIFRSLNMKCILRVVLKKDPLLHVFVHACVPLYIWVAPLGWALQHHMLMPALWIWHKTFYASGSYRRTTSPKHRLWLLTTTIPRDHPCKFASLFTEKVIGLCYGIFPTEETI